LEKNRKLTQKNLAFGFGDYILNNKFIDFGHILETIENTGN